MVSLRSSRGLLRKNLQTTADTRPGGQVILTPASSQGYQREWSAALGRSKAPNFARLGAASVQPLTSNQITMFLFQRLSKALILLAWAKRHFTPLFVFSSSARSRLRSVSGLQEARFANLQATVDARLGGQVTF